MGLVYTMKSDLIFASFVMAGQGKPVELYESKITYRRKSFSEIE
jgi:hypothetical protein